MATILIVDDEPSVRDVIRALKQHFDPHNICNPGGTLGLDMNVEQAAKRWGMREKIG